jgi:hypothetical protein
MSAEVQVTQEDFQAYVDVQEEGLFNMLAPQARELTGLSKEKYMYIINNYGKLVDEFGLEVQ